MPQGNFGAYLNPGAAQPKQSPLAAPQGAQAQATDIQQGPPASPEELAERQSGWEVFLEKLGTDTNVQQSLIRAGAQMLAPAAPGTTQGARIAGGVDAGFTHFNALQDRDANRANANAANARADQQLNNQTRATNAQIDQGQQRIDNQAGQFATSAGQTQQRIDQAGQSLQLQRRAHASRAKLSEAEMELKGQQIQQGAAQLAMDSARAGADLELIASQVELNRSRATTRGGTPGAEQLLAERTATSLIAQGLYDNVDENIRGERAFTDSLEALRDPNSSGTQSIIGRLQLKKIDVHADPLLDEQGKAAATTQIDSLLRAYSNAQTQGLDQLVESRETSLQQTPPAANVQGTIVIPNHPRFGAVTRERIQATADARNWTYEQTLQYIQGLQ